MGVICNRCSGPEDEAYQQDFTATLLDESFCLAHDRGRVGRDAANDEEAFFLHLLDRLEEHAEFRANCGGAGGEPGARSSDVTVEPAPAAGKHAAQPTERELAEAWRTLRSRQLPARGVAEQLIRGVTRWYAKQPSLVRLDGLAPGTRVVVVGDLHGHFGDLARIIEQHGEPQVGVDGKQYLFNGNFVDKGAWGPEVLLLIYCLKLRFPSLVHLNRGSHEDEAQNGEPGNGFRDDHCQRAWGDEGEAMYRLCLASFHQLPLCHVVAGEVAVVHGGLPLDPGVTLAEIAGLDRKRRVPTEECRVLGYAGGQRARARRELRDAAGRRVPAGTGGRLASRIGTTSRARAVFDGEAEPFDVEIVGAPELEQDVEICFDHAADQLRRRSDRLFTALLWSDPIKSDDERLVGPNTARGAGCCFDDRTVATFLKSNGLRSLVRSHQKRHQGYDVEQWSMAGDPLTVTAFSASNFPAGAGEPHGNWANVVVLAVQEGAEEGEAGPGAAALQPAALALMQGAPWRESYSGLSPPTKSKSGVDGEQAAPEEAAQDCQGAVLRVLQELWLMIYCAQPALLAHFRDVDREGVGIVNAQDWASAMHACVLPDDSFPWEELSQYLADFDKAGFCNYGAFLARYGNALSLRLEQHWCGHMLARLSEAMGGRAEVGAEWDKFDRNRTGYLSYLDLHSFLTSHAKKHDLAADDWLYTLLAALDSNRSGYVHRDRFLNAGAREFRAAGPRPALFAGAGEDPEGLRAAREGLQALLRVLARAPGRAGRVLRALDKDRDGSLSRAELRAGLAQLLGDAMPTGFEQWEPLLWRLVDEDDSGHAALPGITSALQVRDVAKERGPFHGIGAEGPD